MSYQALEIPQRIKPAHSQCKSTIAVACSFLFFFLKIATHVLCLWVCMYSVCGVASYEIAGELLLIMTSVFYNYA